MEILNVSISKAIVDEMKAKVSRRTADLNEGTIKYMRKGWDGAAAAPPANLPI